MKFKTEKIYIKSKELRELVMASLRSSPSEDEYLREWLKKLSLQIPFHVGLCLNSYSIEDARLHMEGAETKLCELQIAIDLSISEFLKIHLPDLDSVLSEIYEMIPITLEKAEEQEQERMERIFAKF